MKNDLPVAIVLVIMSMSIIVGEHLLCETHFIKHGKKGLGKNHGCGTENKEYLV